MGVEHYIVCHQCKEYIDLHKAYSFYHVITCRRPPIGANCKETDFNDPDFNGGYWNARGLWFLWHHKGHTEIKLHTDSDDSWYDLEPRLTEVFSHNEDLKIRKRVEDEKK